MSLIDRFQLTVPLIQAPMAGVSPPLLAAAVSEAGGLGSIGVGATDAAGARTMIEEVRSRTSRAFKSKSVRFLAGGEAERRITSAKKNGFKVEFALFSDAQLPMPLSKTGRWFI